jgi:hypothetical protein
LTVAPGDGDNEGKVTVMPWVILLILLVPAVLILAGPPLERIIDRIWPPDGVRPPRDADRPHQRQ